MTLGYELAAQAAYALGFRQKEDFERAWEQFKARERTEQGEIEDGIEPPPAPVAPEVPAAPYWPVSAGLDGLDLERHTDYLESP